MKGQSLAYVLVTIGILALAGFGMGYVAIRTSSQSVLPFYRTQIVQTSQTAENIKFLLDRERRHTFEKILYQIGSHGGYGGDQEEIVSQDCGYFSTLPKHNYVPEKTLPYWYNEEENSEACVPGFPRILSRVTSVAEKFSATPDQDFLNNLETVYGIDLDFKYVYNLLSCGVEDASIDGGVECPTADRDYFENQWFIIGDDKIRLLGTSYQNKPAVTYTATTLVHNLVENKFASLYKESKDFAQNKEYETKLEPRINELGTVTRNETCAYQVSQTGEYSANPDYGTTYQPDPTGTGFTGDRQCTGVYSSGSNALHALNQERVLGAEAFNDTLPSCEGGECETTMVSMCVNGEWTGCVPGVRKGVGGFVWYETPDPEYSPANPVCKVIDREPAVSGSCSEGADPVECEATCEADDSRAEKAVLDTINEEREEIVSNQQYNYTFQDNEASIDYADANNDGSAYAYVEEAYNQSCEHCNPREPQTPYYDVFGIDSYEGFMSDPESNPQQVANEINWGEVDRGILQPFYDLVWNDENDDLEQAPPYSNKQVQSITRDDDFVSTALWIAYGASISDVTSSVPQSCGYDCKGLEATFNINYRKGRSLSSTDWTITATYKDAATGQIKTKTWTASEEDDFSMTTTLPEDSVVVTDEGPQGFYYQSVTVQACVDANTDLTGEARHTDCESVTIDLVDCYNNNDCDGKICTNGGKCRDCTSNQECEDNYGGCYECSEGICEERVDVECVTYEDCESGKVCSECDCVDCTSNAQCKVYGTDYTCSSGDCVPGGGAPQ